MLTLKKLRTLCVTNLIGQRSISTTTAKLQSVEQNDQPKEVKIDMPWGHIAGKWYGSENVRPIVMMHGWQDNAGSFDTLIPLLPKHLSYLAIDLPGHGLSSHLPKDYYYHAFDCVPMLEKIRQNYKWDQISFVAHSLGSILSFMYASFYPKNVNLMCALDAVKIQSFPNKITEQIYVSSMRKSIELNETFMKKPRAYTYNELVQRICDGSRKSITEESAKYLIDRGTSNDPNDPNKFYFTHDVRIRYMQMFYPHHKIGLAYVSRIQAPYLFIRGEDRFFNESEENINEAADEFRKHNELFEMIRVKGTHHLHLNAPESISDEISKFLLKYHDKNGQN